MVVTYWRLLGVLPTLARGGSQSCYSRHTTQAGIASGAPSLRQGRRTPLTSRPIGLLRLAPCGLRVLHFTLLLRKPASSIDPASRWTCGRRSEVSSSRRLTLARQEASSSENGDLSSTAAETGSFECERTHYGGGTGTLEDRVDDLKQDIACREAMVATLFSRGGTATPQEVKSADVLWSCSKYLSASYMSAIRLLWHR